MATGLRGGSGPAAVTFENVSKHYGQVKAVNELSLEIPQGRTGKADRGALRALILAEQ